MNRATLAVAAVLSLPFGAAALAQSPQASTAPTATGPQAAAPADRAAPKGAEPAGSAAAEPSKSPPSRDAAAARAEAGSPRAGKSSDRLELGTTEISGNRELPKVLYVVPWRRPEIGDAVGRPPNSLVEEALTPVDRDVFRRQNRYYAALQAGAAPAKSQPAGAGGASAHAAPKDER